MIVCNYTKLFSIEFLHGSYGNPDDITDFVQYVNQEDLAGDTEELKSFGVIKIFFDNGN